MPLRQALSNIPPKALRDLAESLDLLLPKMGAQAKFAAIIIPIVAREDGWTVLLTERSPHLSSHPGQISFPGGQLESEETPLEAALRETHEETGIQDITILTELGRFASYSGFIITPFVGLVKPTFELQLNDEVIEAFEVPLSYMLDLNHYEKDSQLLDAQERAFYRLPYQNKNIWGFTGTLLYLLAHYFQNHL